MTKNQFMEEFEMMVLPDVWNKEDCVNAWKSTIDSYIEDGLLTKRARKWVNPYVKVFENKLV